VSRSLDSWSNDVNTCDDGGAVVGAVYVGPLVRDGVVVVVTILDEAGAAGGLVRGSARIGAAALEHVPDPEEFINDPDPQ